MYEPETIGKPLTHDGLRGALSRISAPDGGITLHVSDGLSERIFLFDHQQVVLIARGRRPLVADDEPRRAAEVLIRDELMRLVFLEDAFFRVTRGGTVELPPDAVTASMDVETLTREASAWVADWDRFRPVLHGERAVLCLTTRGRERLSDPESPPDRLLDLCGGRQTLRKAWLESKDSLIVFCRGVKCLLDTDLLSVEFPPPETCDPNLLLDRLQEALRTLEGVDLVHERLLALYRRTAQTEKASALLQGMAEAALGRGDRRAAEWNWTRQLELEPGSLEPFQRLVRHFQALGRTQELVSIASRHVPRVLKEEKLSTAHGLCKILRGLPGMEAVVEDLQRELFRLKRRRRKVSERDSIREILLEARQRELRGDRLRSRLLVEKALEYDPDDERLIAWLQRIRSGAPPRRLSRRRTPALFGAALAAIVVGVLGVALARHSEWAPAEPLAHATGQSTEVTGTAAPPPPEPVDPVPSADETIRARLHAAIPTLGDPRPCRRHHGFHACTTHPLGGESEARYAPSCDLTVVHTVSERTEFVLRGAFQARWTVRSDGRRFARWHPGEALSVVDRHTPHNVVVLDWQLPRDTLAVALVDDHYLVRTPRGSTLRDTRGTTVAQGNLGEWDAAAGSLELIGVYLRDTAGQVLGLRGVNPHRLEIVWPAH